MAVDAKTAQVDSKVDLNPRTKYYEFLGPPGALFITLSVPAFTYALFFGCSEKSGGCPPSLPTIWPNIQSAVTDVNWWKSLWDQEAFVAYLAWYAFTVVSWVVLPGDWIEGTLVRDGSRKQYKINGMDSVNLWTKSVLRDAFQHSQRSCLHSA